MQMVEMAARHHFSKFSKQNRAKAKRDNTLQKSPNRHMEKALVKWKNMKSWYLWDLKDEVLVDLTLVLPIWPLFSITTSSRAGSNRDHTYIIHSFDLFNTVGLILLGLFCKWANQSTARTSDLLKINLRTNYQMSWHVTQTFWFLSQRT